MVQTRAAQRRAVGGPGGSIASVSEGDLWLLLGSIFRDVSAGGREAAVCVERYMESSAHLQHVL